MRDRRRPFADQQSSGTVPVSPLGSDAPHVNSTCPPWLIVIVIEVASTDDPITCQFGLGQPASCGEGVGAATVTGNVVKAHRPVLDLPLRDRRRAGVLDGHLVLARCDVPASRRPAQERRIAPDGRRDDEVLVAEAGQCAAAHDGLAPVAVRRHRAHRLTAPPAGRRRDAAVTPT